MEDITLPAVPRAQPPMNLAGVPTPAHSGRRDILAILANTEGSPSANLVFTPPLPKRPGIERSPSRSELKLERAHQENTNSHVATNDPTEEWLNRFHTKKKQLTRRIKNKFSRGNLAGISFEHPVLSGAATKSKEAEAGNDETPQDPPFQLPGQSILGKVKRFVKKTLCIEDSPRSQTYVTNCEIHGSSLKADMRNSESQSSGTQESEYPTSKRDATEQTNTVTVEDPAGSKLKLLDSLAVNIDEVTATPVLDLPNPSSKFWSENGQPPHYLKTLGGSGTPSCIVQAKSTEDTSTTVPKEMHFCFKNNTQSSSVYISITGVLNGVPHALLAKGKTFSDDFYSDKSLPLLRKDIAIPLGPPGSETTITVPHLNSGKVWVCIDEKLEFLLEERYFIYPRLVSPDVRNHEDPNHNKKWGSFLFNFNDSGITANVNYVDCVSIPIALRLESISGKIVTVAGLPVNGLDNICDELRAQHGRDGVDWDRLIVHSEEGNLRVMSPQLGMGMDPTLFSGYFEDYVDRVWSKYRQEGLTVTIDGQTPGIFQGRVEEDCLNFGGFSKDNSNQNMRGYAEVTELLLNALNRTPLLQNTSLPAGVETDYASDTTNHYSRIVRSQVAHGKTFATEKFAPTEMVDQDGKLCCQYPATLSVCIGDSTCF